MRIVVISDSHKRTNVIDEILSAQTFISEKKINCPVCGNCDYNSFLPAVGLETVNGVKILYTHGHTYGVKYGTQRLKEAAKNSGCGIALYGHTHISKTVYEDGIWIVNPGSCSSPREGRASYAVIDIEKNGIMPIIINV